MSEETIEEMSEETIEEMPEDPIWKSREIYKNPDGSFNIANNDMDTTIQYNVCPKDIDPYGVYSFDEVSGFWESLDDSDARKMTSKDTSLEENQQAAAKAKAMSVANSILSAKLMKQVAETAEMTDQELLAIAAEGYFDEWKPGINYHKNKRLVRDGQLYIVVQDVFSQDHQSPDAEGMLGIYRPVAAAGDG